MIESIIDSIIKNANLDSESIEFGFEEEQGFGPVIKIPINFFSKNEKEEISTKALKVNFSVNFNNSSLVTGGTKYYMDQIFIKRI